MRLVSFRSWRPRGRPGDGIVLLVWNDPVDTTIIGYEFRQRNAVTGQSPWIGIEVSNYRTTTAEMRGLTNGVEYTIDVHARNAAGHGQSSIVRATPERPPEAPRDLRASARNEAIILSWDNPGGSSNTRYQIRYEAGAGTLREAWRDIGFVGLDGNRSVHSVTGLMNAIKYTFEVRSLVGEVPGDSSRVTAAAGSPLAPGNFQAAVEGGQVTLTWDDPGDAAITGYQYHQYQGSRPEDPEWMDVDADDAAAGRHTAGNLDNGRRYTFEVRAVNATGPGARDGHAAVLSGAWHRSDHGRERKRK